MKLKTVLTIFVRKSDLAKELGVTPQAVTAWGEFGEIPPTYIKQAKKALRQRKKALDKAFGEVL